MIRVLLACLLLVVAIAPVRSADAHALEPGYLELEALGADQWHATWRKPAVSGRPMAIDVLLPQQCTDRRSPSMRFDGWAYSANWVLTCPGGLAGGRIEIDGLPETSTDVLVRYALEPGEVQTMRLTSRSPAFAVPEAQGVLGIANSYVSLGIEHILGGIDHLLFVLALLLLIRGWRPLVMAITAFTVAHSLSLVAATLGWIVLPTPPVEAAIALSIVFLAVELVKNREGQQTLTARYPWAVAFAFGLLHGLGFARALVEIGLPEGDIPLALVSFNVGVEVGQLLFVGVIILIGQALVRIYPRSARMAMVPQGVVLVTMGYGIGSLASFWMLQRLTLF